MRVLKECNRNIICFDLSDESTAAFFRDMEGVKGMWCLARNEGCRAWGALKSVLSNRGLGIKAKKCLYEGVSVPTACMEQRHGYEKCCEKESECS